MEEYPKKAKRSYIRRKRLLVECAQYIQSILEFIYSYKDEDVTDEQIARESYNYAMSVESVCWSPQLHLSPEEYRGVMMLKAQDLGVALLSRALPPGEYTKLLAEFSRQLNTDNSFIPQIPPLPNMNNKETKDEEKTEPAGIEPLEQKTDIAWGFDSLDGQFGQNEFDFSDSQLLDGIPSNSYSSFDYGLF